MARRGRDLAWERKVEAVATVRGPQVRLPLPKGGLARAGFRRILAVPLAKRGEGGWVFTSRRCVALRYQSGEKKPAVQGAGFLDGQD